MKLKPKKIILDLLLAAEGRPLSARDAISACGLFGISENNVRVNLTRLSAEGMIEAASRGAYRLSESAMKLGGEVQSWRKQEERLRPWKGQYVMAYTGMLGRSDRGALQRRERALELLGFREYRRGLYIRPDNIEQDVEAVRRRLYSLGLETEAVVCLANEFSEDQKQEIHALWDTWQLNAGYRDATAQMQAWMRRSDDIEPEVAARECFLIGGNAIRQLVFDPLLPETFVDAKARHEFLQTLIRFDRLGQGIWRNLYETTAGMPKAHV